jgi:hypothetical protein
MLMLLEPRHEEIFRPGSLVSQDELIVAKLLQQSVNVAVVVGKNLGIDPQRPVLQFPVPVRHAPQTGEANSRERAALREHLVGEKTGFDLTSSEHFNLMLACVCVPGNYREFPVITALLFAVPVNPQ